MPNNGKTNNFGKETNAQKLFPNVRVVCCHRYLGGCIGSSAEQARLVMNEVEKRVDNVEALTEFATETLQAAYKVPSERMGIPTTGCEVEYEPLKTTIQQKLTPAIL
ncbi:Hypothetical protein NTJ_16107 [Nesidiocoris tenuis]|uniref:Uncharacterized protein n=1 Tax=Nesidiocoris tenuis TaxID=355587 RepID=A0ABN7BFZ5_9HEMI|nr:Hypothetical protein NTJ_16107 [Nesidiocoris tenuis]